MKINESVLKDINCFEDLMEAGPFKPILDLLESCRSEVEDERLSMVHNAESQLRWISQSMDGYISDEEMRAVDRLLFSMDIQKKALEESILAMYHLMDVSQHAKMREMENWKHKI